VKPTITKPKPEPTLQIRDDSEDEQDKVAESQAVADAVDDLDSDGDSSDYASDVSHTPKRRKVQKKNVEEAKDKPKEGVVKTAARKIKASAHANYRRLKIKSKGGSGNGGAKGKFGRRR
jgi:hypothetical protein